MKKVTLTVAGFLCYAMSLCMNQSNALKTLKMIVYLLLTCVAETSTEITLMI